MVILAVTLSLGFGGVTVHATASGSTVSNTARKVESRMNNCKNNS